MKGITINTDASYDPQYNLGSYAFWIVCDGQRIIKAGILKKVSDSNDAEIQAIANALVTVFKSDFKGITGVYVNTKAFAYVNGAMAARPLIGPAKVCYDTLQLIKQKYRIRRNKFYEIRQVNAHTGHQDLRSTRQYVNDYCDRTARQVLRDAIKTLGK